MRQILEDVRVAVTGQEPVPVLATDGGAGPVKAYGGSGLTNQLIELAGGVNVLADLDQDYADVSVEAVAASSPEAMIVTDYLPGPTAAEKFGQVAELVPESPAALHARYLALPAAGQHPGYRNVLALRDIAEFLHPDAFQE